MADETIVRCAIHPGIGIARLGNSPNGYFIGPEVPGIVPDPGGAYKDAQGRIKRQVARFRIFGLNAANQVVKELTADDAAITWRVHLANKKAAWYQFWVPLDIPEASSPAIQSKRRNANKVGAARKNLVIDGGARTIPGKSSRGPQYHFDSGQFLGHSIPLGELRTGGSGNLLVFGGFGHSDTPVPNNPPTRIANNPGWHDDVSDGPVSATVVLGGKSLPVAPAWVIVVPPNYAPGVTAVVTLFDIAYQAYLDGNPQPPRPVSFTRDIYPILERFDHLQWVNQGFFQGYGWKGQVPLLDPTHLNALASNAPANAPSRQDIFNRFRDPTFPTTQVQDDTWPHLYGDNFNQPPQDARQYLAVTREQYRCLSQWALGQFLADWNPGASRPQQLSDIPRTDRPLALDRAALEACAGGPFHPGTEATWPLRQPSMYVDLCRLRVRTAGDPPEPDYGAVLTPAAALGPNGPLHRSGPGDITRWMAVPWQTDTANCGSAYSNSTQNPSPLPDLPTFWPAAVPNRVLTQQAYERIMSGGLSPTDRQTAFQGRVPWSRHLPQDFTARNRQIITSWYRLGIVTHRPGPPGDPTLPGEMLIELESGFPETAPHALERRAAGDVDEMGQHSAPPLDDWNSHL